MKKIFITFALFLGLVGLSHAQTTNSSQKPVVASKTTAKFVIKQNPEDANGNPSSNISIIVGSKTRSITKITGNAQLIDKAEFASKGIPKKALSACGAWWAGSGDYFYVVNTNNQIVIYKGWQDETQTEKSFHWKKFKTLKTL